MSTFCILQRKESNRKPNDPEFDSVIKKFYYKKCLSSVLRNCADI